MKQLFGSFIVILIALLALIAQSPSRANSTRPFPGGNTNALRLAQMSEAVSVQAAGKGNPSISLSDGRDLLTASGQFALE